MDILEEIYILQDARYRSVAWWKLTADGEKKCAILGLEQRERRRSPKRKFQKGNGGRVVMKD